MKFSARGWLSVVVSFLIHTALIFLPIASVGNGTPQRLKVTLVGNLPSPLVDKRSPATLRDLPSIEQKKPASQPQPAQDISDQPTGTGFFDIKKDLGPIPYPELAYSLGLSGRVEFFFRVGKDGRAEDIRILGGENSDYFSSLVIEALSQHEFSSSQSGNHFRGLVEFTHPNASVRGRALGRAGVP